MVAMRVDGLHLISDLVTLMHTHFELDHSDLDGSRRGGL